MLAKISSSPTGLSLSPLGSVTLTVSHCVDEAGSNSLSCGVRAAALKCISVLAACCVDSKEELPNLEGSHGE